MKKFLIYNIILLLVISCDNQLRVSEDYEITYGGDTFSSELILLYSVEDPKLKMHPSGIDNVKYNIASWEVSESDNLLEKVQRDAAQQGDGFDDSILNQTSENRSADLFSSGENIELVPEKLHMSGDTTLIYYQENEHAEVSAKVYQEGSHVCFKVEMKPLIDGFFSLGYLNAPSLELSMADEMWQPMIWQEKRFPENSYLTLAYRCPIPSALATYSGHTYGVMAHPEEFPFQPLPTLKNSRFGIAVRNKEGAVQPMLFAPVLGGAESKMSASESYCFTAVLYAGDGNCTDNYEKIATSFFGFKDYRKNDISTLNQTLENIVNYAMSDYSWFIDSLKGCAYSTDVPGAVKNVSSLNPLGLALVTENSDMLTKRAYPIMEYQLSREKFLFSLDREQKIQHPSRKLLGPVAPVSELTSLYSIFDGNIPFLLSLAEENYNSKRIRNLTVPEEGNTWMNSMFMFKATNDETYLRKAIEGADNYIQARMETPQTEFDAPLDGGFFFWSGYTPRWIYLLELFEITGEQKYLDAAQKGARYYTMFCWMSPSIPSDSILVNEGGKAPLYWYLKSKGHKQMFAEEEMAPAWRLSEIGLTPESSGTSTGHRAIFMANYAPWMLRIGHLAEDEFLKNTAKAAIVGRYSNFPGYHINTARTTIYEKEDYPIRPHKDLSVNSFHYNHIMPMASMILDYMVTDAFVKSDGQIDFPSVFIEGYAYMQNKFYGHKKGEWYNNEVWLWMPPKLVQTGSVELNYIAARGEKKVFLAFSNQSGEDVSTWVKLNSELIVLTGMSKVIEESGKEHSINEGRFEIIVPPGEQVAVTLTEADAVTTVQQVFEESGEKWTNDFQRVELGNTNAMIMNLGKLAKNLYIYLEDGDDIYSSVQFSIRQGGETTEYMDNNYPYEFTTPVSCDSIEFSIMVKEISGNLEKSDWVKLNR